MKLSLTMIKDVFKAVRGIVLVNDKEEFNLLNAISEMNDDILNDVCSAISQKKEINYAEDLLGEEGALEVISDFLLNIISNYQKSKKFKMLINTYLSPKMKTLFSKIKDNLPNSELS